MLDCRIHVSQMSFASVLIILTNNVHDHFPVWSPDGTRIAFMHWQHDHWEIYVMNADGTGRQALTRSSAYVERRPNNVASARSPDGKQIVFLSNRSGEWEFYVMKTDGSHQRQILENVTDQLDIQYNGVYERVISWSWWRTVVCNRKCTEPESQHALTECRE